MLPLSPGGDASVSQGPIHTPDVREDRDKVEQSFISKHKS